MKQLTISQATTVYDTGAVCELGRCSVQHDKFAKFCLDVGEFCKQSSAIDADDYWEPVTRLIRRIRFEVNAFPISFSKVASMHTEALVRIRRKLNRCEHTHPAISTNAKSILEGLQWLESCTENPMLQTIMRLHDDCNNQSAILLKESRGIAPVLEAFQANSMPAIDVYVSNQLCEDVRCDKLSIIGPSFWYPKFVFTAPRTQFVQLIHYAGINDRWNPQNVFLGSDSRAENVEYRSRRGRIVSECNSSEKSSDPSLLPSIEATILDVDWSGLLGKVRGVVASSSEELVMAKVFLLEDSHAVLLDSSESANATVVDLEREPSSRVYSCKVRDIEAGMLVALRSGGGGDYIVDVANMLLGDDAERARDAQHRWKTLLRDKVKRDGIQVVSTQLQAAGSTRSSVQNVRNWMSYRSIKTQDNNDFFAIMKVIGLQGEAEEIWTTMTKIATAHAMAGQRIRAMLIDKIQESDERDLQLSGHLEFSLEDAGSGGISVFRVVEIHEDTVQVPECQIGQLLRDEGDEWQ